MELMIHVALSYHSGVFSAQDQEAMFVFLVFHCEFLFLCALLGLALALCWRLTGQTGESVKESGEQTARKKQEKILTMR